VGLETQRIQLIATLTLCLQLQQEINMAPNFMGQLLFLPLLVEVTGLDQDVESASKYQLKVLQLFLKELITINMTRHTLTLPLLGLTLSQHLSITHVTWLEKKKP